MPSIVTSQDLSGKWKGFFTPNSDLDGKVINYEIVIKEAPDHSLSGKTYSIISNSFTAAALATGIHSENTQQVSITETKFDRIKLIGNFQACLMTNFLTYKALKGREILEGTYTATNETLKSDCGGGKVYLEKEIPITKQYDSKQYNPKKLIENSALTKENKSKPNKPKLDNKENKTILNTTQNTDATSVANKNTLTQNTIPNNNFANNTNENYKIENNVSTNNSNKSSGQILPWVLVGRENKLVKQVFVNSPSISIDLYDNGTIDNDTIMIFDNKKLLLDNRRLSYKSTHFDINFSSESPTHEIIIVAQNLGLVPPNTALMVVKDGSSRQEIYITSTLTMNAMIIFEQKKLSP